MRKEWKYYLILGSALLLLILLELLAPTPADWTFSLHHKHKSPYGTYILFENLSYLFPEQAVSTVYRSLYELQDQAYEQENILIFAADFSPDAQDAKVLWNIVDKGGSVFAAARTFGGKLADTLKLETDTRLQEGIVQEEDTLEIRESLYYFSAYDSLRMEVLAQNESGDPVLLRFNKGEGALLLSSVPQAYTNYFMLEGELYQEAVRSLSFLPLRDVLWNEYYHLGRMEPATPLRFLLSVPALRWAVYLSLAGLLLFMIFESKRRQRAVPVLLPPSNTTLDFVQTVSNLFMQGSNHQEMARKKIIYLREYLLSRFRLEGEWQDQNFRERVAHKTAKDKGEVDKTFDFILTLQNKQQISSKELLVLNQNIDSFYSQEAII
ncbi:hypothetical protein OKW21_005867 [Catalinimonas alkaloidigena]|uniref:hypothetical protein n=1 Tax=Catalinimonas alkaloidigena TaxID=1075417 RepID=UPI002407439C|nr:hypothetical protein [Catalinimonas alkaloidigena]MDF9800604.1 hypothetical protein [Catalinimonas alkaloidigena]